MDILSMLETLADLHTEQAALREAQAGALPVRLRDQLAAVRARFAPQLEAVASRLALAERQVREAVLQHGASVKSPRLHAIFVTGRALWDDAMLAGYAVEHPAVLACRSEGKPSVTIRKVQP